MNASWEISLTVAYKWNQMFWDGRTDILSYNWPPPPPPINKTRILHKLILLYRERYFRIKMIYDMAQMTFNQNLDKKCVERKCVYLIWKRVTALPFSCLKSHDLMGICNGAPLIYFIHSKIPCIFWTNYQNHMTFCILIFNNICNIINKNAKGH